MIQVDNTAFRDDSFVSDDMTSRIGGRDPAKFVPNINLSWGGHSGRERFWLNLNRPAVVSRGQPLQFANSRARFESADNEADIFSLDSDGSLKWDIEFAIKPTTNTFSWSLQHAPGVQFFHQPPLTAVQIDEGGSQPDNIAGSYAVYCNASGRLRTSDNVTIQNFKNGKLGHLMRPLVSDASGATVWAEMNIANKILTVTIPQEFLDSATYPVTLDPTFGYDGGTPGTAIGMGYAKANDAGDSPYTATTGDTITEMHIYCRAPSSGGCSMAAYTHSGGNPVNRLAAAAAIIGVNSTPAWRTTGVISQSLVNGTRYVLAHGNETGSVNFYVDYGSAGSSSRNSSSTLTATWSRGSGSNQIHGMYATYTVASSDVIPPLYYHYNAARRA